MNVSEFLQEVRDTLEDPGPTYIWSDAQLLRFADRHQRGMARTQSSIDNDWHNCEINLLPGKFVQRTDTLFEYVMRQWVMKPTLVWDRSSPVDEALDKENPWNLENADLTPMVDTIGRPYRLATSKRDRRGFLFTKSRTLQVMGVSAAASLMVQATKLPARLFTATLDLDGLNDQEFYLPASLTLGTEEREVDAYRNAIIEFVGGGDENHPLEGEIRIVVASLHNEYVGGVRHTRVKLDRPLPAPPRKGDRIESVFEVADESMQFPILLTARSAWTQKNMAKSIASILDDLRKQERMFTDHCQPRQQQEPKRIRKGLRQRRFGHGKEAYEFDPISLYA
jgi:hypothetical protein